MRVEWIAAALSPADVSPHPNFRIEGDLHPHQLLALLAQLRFADFERASAPPLEPATLGEQAEHLMVAAVRMSLSAATVKDGAARLVALIAGDADLDPGCRVAGALFAAVALSEMDQQREAVEVLRAVTGALPNDQSADVRLAKAALLQQIALRRMELGEFGLEEATESLSLLRSTRASGISSFSTSKGVRWPSSHTARLIIEELEAIADAHTVNSRGRVLDNEWMRFVRAPAPVLGLLVRRGAEEGFSKYLDETFDSFVGSSGRTIYVGDPVESGVYGTLLHFELMGASPTVRTWRSRMGKLRLMRASPEDSAWASQEAVRLLRQADDLGALEKTLQRIRAAGPLVSLHGDAAQIVRGRTDARTIRRVDVIVLSAAAHMLEKELAGRALDRVLEWLAIVRAGSLPTLKWESQSTLLETGWIAAVNLGAPSERLDEVVERLLVAVQEAEASDELLRRGLARAAAAVEWEGTQESIRQDWASWLDTEGSHALQEVREVVAPELGLHERPPSADGIERAAAVLNSHYRAGMSPDSDELDSLEVAVADALGSVRQQAEKGVHGFGGIPVSVVAVGLAVDLGVSGLWEPLKKFLLSPHVSRSDKSAALDRLATERSVVPDAWLTEVGSAASLLLTSPPTGPFETGVSPFPAALRFLTAYQLLSESEILSSVTRLAGNQGSAGRVEAARTLSLLAFQDIEQDWADVLAIQLSEDGDVSVRAEAGRCLAMRLGGESSHQRLLERRVMELLGTDGILVPLLVLRGLQDADVVGSLGEGLLAQISRIAGEHPARGVRLQAAAVLG